MRTGARLSLQRTVVAAMTLAATLAFAPMATAHGSRPTGPVEGLRIESLTHGQMAVLARYRAAIMNLAAVRTNTDEPFRRIMNYASIQFSMCLWGLAPGGISDETSPFNECSHAYLAATRTVLMRMKAMGGPDAKIDALISRIDADMVRNQASLVLCEFSDEAFYTGNVIRPDWRAVVTHKPSMAAMGALGLFVAGSFFVAARKLKRQVPSA